MGIFDIFDKDDGAIETGLTAGALGAILGDKLDERQWRHDVLRLLQQQLASARFDREMRRVDQILATIRESQAFILRYGDWSWSWEYPTVCERMHREFLHRNFTDREFGLRVNQQYRRWADLSRRSEAVGIMPFVYMPRTICGDIAGTDKMLSWAMDRLEAEIDIREHEQRLNRKWGEK
jgi:hypothetical protein